jgi:hypothetical protein
MGFMKHRDLLVAAVGLLSVMSFLALGCEPEAGTFEGPANGNSYAGSGSQGGSGGAYVPVGQDQGALCPIANATQPCSCDKNGQQVPGRQTCNTVSGWSQCECSAKPETVISNQGGGSSDSALNKGDARFNWERTMPLGGSCEAGNYAGAFTGLYASQALIQATMGFYTTIPVAGDVKFNINEKPGSNGEWFEISDGHFIGTALAMFPFDGDFYGALECSTRSFQGTLENCYYMVGGDKYAFQGIAVSNYDTFNHTFVGGMWSVTEPEGNAIFDSPGNPDAGYPLDDLFPEPLPIQAGTPFQGFFPPLFAGGAGDWNAAYVGP